MISLPGRITVSLNVWSRREDRQRRFFLGRISAPCADLSDDWIRDSGFPNADQSGISNPESRLVATVLCQGFSDQKDFDKPEGKTSPHEKSEKPGRALWFPRSGWEYRLRRSASVRTMRRFGDSRGLKVLDMRVHAGEWKRI
jgi:hypothetical protein